MPLEFKRPTGLIGSLPRKWIDERLPKCPFCKESTLWEHALEKKEKDSTFEHIFGQIPQKWYEVHHFRCPNCQAILAVPQKAIRKMPIIYDGSLFPGLVKLSKQIEYKKSEKDWDGTMLIESVGTVSERKDLVGQGIALTILQEWAS
jgi:hypothetical protein